MLNDIRFGWRILRKHRGSTVSSKPERVNERFMAVAPGDVNALALGDINGGRISGRH